MQSHHNLWLISSFSNVKWWKYSPVLDDVQMAKCQLAMEAALASNSHNVGWLLMREAGEACRSVAAPIYGP